MSAEAEVKKVEEPVKAEEEADDMPELETVAPTEGMEIENPHTSRAERKARKALSKLGLKPFAGIQRVSVRKQKNPFFSIDKPDVFKVLFGLNKQLSEWTYFL